MKKKVRIFSIILSLFLFFFSVWNCTLNVFAFPKFDWSDMSWKEASWEEVEGEVMATLGYVSTSLSAVTDGNFSQFIANYYDFKSLWDESGWLKDQIVVDSNDNTITFSDDLTAYMKQALIEYAEETNGFKLIATTDYHDLSASDFASGYVYHSFRNIVHENGLVAITGGGVSGNVCNQSLSFAFFLPFDKDSIKNSNSSGSVSLVKASGFNSPYFEKIFFYDSLSWDWLNYTVYDCKVYYNTDEGHTAYKVITSFDECEEKTSGIKTDFQDVGYSYIGWNPILNFSKNYSGYFLYSTDGRKLKVFNSLNALKNYSVGDRSVYFGSGFYDTPGEIQVSFDDLEKYIDGKYDSFFDDLKDLIGDNEDNLTEEDLEKLVDKILDKMDDIGGNNKPGDSTGDNSGILDGISDALEGITSTISGYLDAILMYLESILTDLDYIVMQYQDMTEEDAKTKTDSALNELKGTFSEVGDMMTKKFPFCIPWDLKQLFVTLNGGKDYSGEDAAMLLSGGDIEGYAAATPENPELPTFSGYTGSGKLVDVIIYSSPSSRASPSSGENGIMMLSADDTGNGGTTGNDTAGADAGVYRSESGAPVFHIPFVLNSIGLNSALVIDMSPFDGVSDISRTLFLLIFIYQLILLSIRITEFLEGFIG